MESKYHPYQRTVWSKGKQVKRWYLWYYDANGRQVSKSCGQYVHTRYEAEQLALRLQQQHKTLEWFSKGFFNEDSDYIIRSTAKGKTLSEKTLKDYRHYHSRYLLTYFGAMALSELTPDLVEGTLLTLSISNSTKNKVIGVLKVILKEAVRKGLLAAVPVFERFQNDSVRRDVLLSKELEIIFPDDPALLDSRWGADGLLFGSMCAVAVSCGLRSGEVRGLERPHLHLPLRCLEIVQALDSRQQIVNPKSSTKGWIRKRVVPIPDKTIHYLQTYLSTRKDNAQWLFLYDSHPVRVELLRKRFAQALRINHIPTEGRKLDLHSLRYTYNTIMASRLPHDLLREWIGHRSEAMTQHYFQPQLEDKMNEWQQYRQVVDGFWQ